jgi:hypothetical protein
LQRLSSIRNFAVKKTLRLTNLEFLTQLNGKTYDELDRDLQRIIKETTVVVYIINPGTPVDVKFNIFKRINTGGLILEPQEIRHALFQGAPANFIADLAACSEFGEATTWSLARNKRMLDRDFANRFLCFYLLGYEKYEPDLDTFMSKAMAAIYDLSERDKEQIKNNFIGSMNLNKAIFERNAFRKIDATGKRKPINKAVFDVFSVHFALLNDGEREIIRHSAQAIKDGFSDLLWHDEAFFWAVSSATGDKNRVNYRHKMIKNLIHDIISNHDQVN